MKHREYISEETKTQLRSMGLPYMAELINEFEQSPDWLLLTFTEKLEMIINRLYQERNVQRIKRLKRLAKLRYPNASIMGIHYTDERALNRSQILELGSCGFLRNETNIIIEGPTGSGKTHLACAIGNACCEHDIRTIYIRFPDFIQQYEEIRDKKASRRKFISKYAKCPLLIMDEWLMSPVTKEVESLLLEIMEIRHTESSTIFCSQYKQEDWHDLLGGGVQADSILDRIIHKQLRIQIGKMNMRAMK